jgi:uncharacterized membrane protein YccC
MRRLHLLVDKLRIDMEAVAYAVARDRPSFSQVEYRSDLAAVEDDLKALAEDSHHVPPEALTALTDTFAVIRGAVALIEQLHAATRTLVEPSAVLPGSDMTPFLTRQKYELGLIWSQMRWSSPSFRFALRMALAIAAGLWLAAILPYASHNYWVLLTIIVILKPTFSLTKQRRYDRLFGTVIGCVFTAVLLHYTRDPRVLLPVLFVAMAAGTAFVTIKYFYSAIATCVQVLVQINLLMPGSQSAVSERLIDTLIGGLVATVFAFVLPSWEYRALPQMVEAVLDANRRYIAATRDLLLGVARDDYVYRVQRKQFMDGLSALVAAFVRMLDEPKSRHRAVDNLNRFITQNYLVAAHVAAVRILMRQRIKELDPVRARQAVEGACNAATESLRLATERLKQGEAQGSEGTRPKTGAAAVEAERIETRTTVANSADRAAVAALTAEVVEREEDHTDAMHLLERRLRALRADAAKIALRTGAIGVAVQRED